MRVLIVDLKENEVSVADFRTGMVKPVGSVGQGPLEYRGAGFLTPLSPESTIMVDDMGGRRWIILKGSEIVGGIPRHVEPNDGRMKLVSGNGRGLLLAVPESPFGSGAETTADSSPLLAISWQIRTADTLTWLSSGATDAQTRQGRDRAAVVIPAFDIPVALADGWVAIARVSPFRVDWISPNGHLNTGQPLPWPARWTDADKQAYLDQRARAVGMETAQVSQFRHWPRRPPPIMSGWGPDVLATPEGRVLVLRIPVGNPRQTIYDVFDRRGGRVGRLTLPADQRIIAFGAAAVYVASADSLGRHWLHRHAWP